MTLIKNPTQDQQKALEQIRNYIVTSYVVDNVEITSGEEKQHCKEMIEAIIYVLSGEHDISAHGSFINHLIKENWEMAVRAADNINRKYIAMYILAVSDIKLMLSTNYALSAELKEYIKSFSK